MSDDTPDEMTEDIDADEEESDDDSEEEDDE